jgi:hypothetical protein
MKLETTVAEIVTHVLNGGNLFDGEVFLTSPRVNLRQVNRTGRTGNCVF